MARGDVIAVRTEVVRAVLVDGIAEEVVRRAASASPPAALAAARRHVDATAAVDVAHAGWLARAIEEERFDRARAGAPWLLDALSERAPTDPASAVDAVCGDLAAREPLARPRPDDPAAATWRLPGPGGHVRHELALAAIAAAGGGPPELKRCWVHGLLVRGAEGELARRGG